MAGSKCSALGAYVGILPGVGGGTAQWVAYAYAVQSSPNRERFGKGAVEGVLGPGAANNSTRGGDLITTVAFGIPSSVSTAILFGAFLIQGIVPGPDMLNPAKHSRLLFRLSGSLSLPTSSRLPSVFFSLTNSRKSPTLEVRCLFLSSSCLSISAGSPQKTASAI